MDFYKLFKSEMDHALGAPMMWKCTGFFCREIHGQLFEYGMAKASMRREKIGRRERAKRRKRVYGPVKRRR